MSSMRAFGELRSAWARGRLDDPASRRGRASSRRWRLSSIRATELHAPFFQASARASSRPRRDGRGRRALATHRRSVGARRARPASALTDAVPASPPRRHPAQARSRRIPRPPRTPIRTAIAIAQAAGRAQLRPARGAFARQALPIDRPPRRRPRRPRARARRLCADAGNAGDRRGAGAARGAGGDGRGQGRGGAAATTAQLHVAYGNALIAARGYRARRKRRKPSPEPASRRPATRMRPNGWRPTTAYGSAASCGASCRR